MKFISLFAAAVALFGASFAVAQTYPTTTPVYIPSASLVQKTLTAPGTVPFVVNGVSTMSVRISGLSGSLVASVQVSNDPIQILDAAATWTTVSVTPVGGGQPVSSLTANGFWYVALPGVTRARVNATTVSGSVKVNMAASPAASPYVDATNGQIMSFAQNAADPCLNPFVTKSSAVVNISTATTTAIVPAVAGKVVYVCEINTTVVGTSPTIKVIYGTQASTPCDTGATNLSGTFAPTSGTTLVIGAGIGTIAQTPVANAFCLVTGGTTPSVQGIASYVQQ